MSVTFKITIVRDKNGQTLLQMMNVFKYALSLKIDYIAVMAKTDRLDFFSYIYIINILYIHHIYIFIEIFFHCTVYVKKNHQGQHSHVNEEPYRGATSYLN